MLILNFLIAALIFICTELEKDRWICEKSGLLIKSDPVFIKTNEYVCMCVCTHMWMGMYIWCWLNIDKCQKEYTGLKTIPVSGGWDWRWWWLREAFMTYFLNFFIVLIKTNTCFTVYSEWVAKRNMSTLLGAVPSIQ